MKYCVNCKKEYLDDISYCPECGMSLFKKPTQEEIKKNNENMYYKTSLIITIIYLIVFGILFIVFKIISEIGSGLSGDKYIFDIKEFISLLTISSSLVLIPSLCAFITSFKRSFYKFIITKFI